MTGAHRDINTPWRITLTCWYTGHTWQPITRAYDRCDRCDRIKPTGDQE